MPKYANLDGQGEEIDVLKGLDLHVLDKTSKLGNRDPFLISLLATTSATPATTTAPSTTTAPASKTSTESTSTTGWCCVRHC